MSKLLLTWSPDWADECNYPGFEVMTSEKWEEYKKEVLARDNINWYFGTNECNEYRNPQELLDQITVTPISDSQAEVVHQLFEGSFGAPLPEFEDEDW